MNKSKLRMFVQLLIVIIVTIGDYVSSTFLPNWDSLDSRPLPQWYDDAKFGIFIHWGVYSVPAIHSEWFWYDWKSQKDPEINSFMQRNYPPNFSYPEFAKDFTAELLDFDYWTQVIRDSGAKYVVLTAKHHEGYTLWPSEHTFNWNSVDIGPKRNIVGDFAKSLKKSLPNVRFGVYYSLYEWYNPLYQTDKESNFLTDTYVTSKVIPEIKELIVKYEPDILWSDGDWEANDTYWGSKELLAWLYNESPTRETIVTNDRWGRNVTCNHGDFFTCQDRFEPNKLIGHKWENCMTIDKLSWGYRRNAHLNDYFDSEELITKMIKSVSLNGNIIMNIGPNRDGTINPIFHDRLKGVGNWLKVNGEAIFNTKPWVHQQDELNENVWYTRSKDTKSIYAAFLKFTLSEYVCVRNLREFATDGRHFEVLGANSFATYFEMSTMRDQVCFKFLKNLPFKIVVIKVLL